MSATAATAARDIELDRVFDARLAILDRFESADGRRDSDQLTCALYPRYSPAEVREAVDDLLMTGALVQDRNGWLRVSR